MRGPRIALVALLAGMAAVHAIAAAWTPIQGDDWNAWIWHARHLHDGIGAWLATHVAFSEAIGYGVARSNTFHVIASLVVDVALVIGLFTVAMRRLPSATWTDVLGIALVSALLWIAQPHAGVAWFHRSSFATYVCGAAVAAWLVAPFRCGWHVPRSAWPLLALAGYCTGTSTRAIATASLIGVAIAMRRHRVRWMWFALGGLVVGTIVGYVRAPWIELGRVFRRGFEPNFLVLKLPVEEAGRLFAVILALALVDALLGGRAPGDTRPDARDALRWAIAWAATSIWCLFGPHYFEATLFPATCMLVIGALPFALWFATARGLRGAIVAFAIAVHAVVWPVVLVTYHGLDDEGAARLAAIEATAPGGVAIVRPYAQSLPTFWFFGEDLTVAHLRASLATEVFGLRDIAFEPEFRRLELTPKLELALAVDDTSEADLRAAAAPAVWSGEISVARDQFALFVKRLKTVTGKPVVARLVVTNVTMSELGARPLLAAWSDAKGLVVVPRIALSTLDENNELTLKIYGDDVARFDEAWIVHDGVTTHTPYRNGSPRVRPTTPTLQVIVTCNRERCLVADAFVARF